MEAQSVILLPNDELRSIKAQLQRIETGLAKNIHDVNRECLYTDDEFCEILKCSKKTAQNWRNRGYLGFVQMGMFIRYRKSDILNFCEKFQVKPNFKG
jgi:hypothetical protein